MFKEYISDEDMINMAAVVAMSIDAESYEKGKGYYDRGRVEWAKLFGPRIFSVVNDGKRNTVIIHLDDFSQSTCACVKRQFCEHIAAVFLHYYEPWLALKRGLSSAAYLTATKKAFINSLSPQSEDKGLDFPVREGPVERWYEYFEREYNKLEDAMNRRFQPYAGRIFDGYLCLNMRFKEFIDAVSAHSDKWPITNKNLYCFHSILFFMTRLEKSVENVDSFFLGDYQTEGIASNFNQALGLVMFAKRCGECRPFFHKAAELVRENFLLEKDQLFAWIHVYRVICANLLDGQGLESETACLEGLMKGLNENENRQGYYFAALGLAGLKMLANRSDDALAILQGLEKKNIEDMSFYLRQLTTAKKWQELLVWLRWLDKEIKKATPSLLECACNCCILATKNSRAGEEFMDLVKSWLPRSYDFYAGYLLDTDLYREWVELNMYCRGYDWQSVNKGALRRLESQDPSALIPLYHQWAARLIEKKNRKSYREAIELLKKLRSLYNKQKMRKEWETFISRLASYYSRMRAFQEELQKGKLIS